MEPKIDNQGEVPRSNAPTLNSALDVPIGGPFRPVESTPVPAAMVNQGAILDESPDTPIEEPTSILTRPSSRQRFIGLGLLTFGLIAALLIGVRIELNKSKTPILNTSQQVKPQTVSLSELGSQLGTSSQTLNTLTVNGRLAVNSAIDLLPTTKPNNATLGELYYDQGINQLGYYNGSGFIYLQGSGSSPSSTTINNITNVIGSSGNISGSGTPGTIALFNTASTLGNSILTQTGTNVTVAGAMSLKGSSNSTTAFQVQNSSGSNLLTADTTSNAIVLGNDGALSAVTVRGGQAAGSNVSGTNLTLVGSNGTGSANGGDIILETGQTPQGGIQFDNTSKTAQNGSTISMTYTVGTQRSRLLVVTLDWSSTSVTYDGRPLTLLGSIVSGKHFGGGVNIYMWYLVNPPSGTFTLAALNGATGSTMSAVSYYNVNQTTPFGTVVSATGNLSGTQSSSMGVTTSSSSQVVAEDFGVDNTSGTCTPASGQTLRWSVVQSFFPVMCGGDIVATGGSMTLQWTVTQADWADIAAPINPAVPGSAPMQFPTPTTPDTLYDRLHITAAGNVGIDNSNPQYALDVSGTINASASVYTPILDTANATALVIGNLNASSIQLGNASSNIATSILGTAIVKPTPNNDSPTDFQIQNAAGTPLFVANTSSMSITISGTSSSFGTLVLSNAHINSTQTTAPGISSPLNCGTGATATLTAGSTDTTGSYTIKVGTGSPTTCDVTLTFNGAYGSAPNVILTPGAVGGATAPISAWVSGTSSTSFTTQIAPTNATAGATYSYYYWVAQ